MKLVIMTKSAVFVEEDKDKRMFFGEKWARCHVSKGCYPPLYLYLIPFYSSSGSTCEVGLLQDFRAAS